ncbi:MAG: family 43 glycosylhydrolase [Pedobacter sp.]|nr:family 43 glycosylhydrolase [Pedobacter sp.]
MRFLSRCLLISFVVCASAFCVSGQLQKAVIPGDFADPSVIRKGNQYYAVGTSSEWAPHFPIYTSTNLKDWKQTGFVFDKAPEWTSGSFWAPEYYFHNNTYFLYYTARRKKDNVSYIGVATSAYPDRGFIDHGVIIEYGKEAIDAFVYNENGELFITFKAYGLDNRPIEILGSKLSADGLKLVGEPFTLFKDDKKVGLEGQSIIKKDGFYYLFYSAGNCCGIQCDYNVRVARSKDFKGPYIDFDKNPILQENADWKCSGHGTFVNTPEGKTFYLYHSYNKKTTVYTGRQGMLAELTWSIKGEWPVFREANGSNVTMTSSDVIDDFSTKKPSLGWQWDFRNSSPVLKQVDGRLQISGSINATNKSGVAITRRPVSTNFEMVTTVVNYNTAQKGLVYYGDANSSIGIGVIGSSVEFWEVKGDKRSVLASGTITSKSLVTLKLSVDPDLSCKVFYKTGSSAWKELSGSETTKVDFLTQWDRSPRIGLNFKGSSDQNAVFSSFRLTYN